MSLKKEAHILAQLHRKFTDDQAKELLREISEKRRLEEDIFRRTSA